MILTIMQMILVIMMIMVRIFMMMKMVMMMMVILMLTMFIVVMKGMIMMRKMTMKVMISMIKNMMIKDENSDTNSAIPRKLQGLWQERLPLLCSCILLSVTLAEPNWPQGN